MIDILKSSDAVLADAGYSTGSISLGDHDGLLFESDTVLGFLLVYDTSNSLLKDWSSDSEEVIRRCQFGLRSSDRKAWNTYLVLLTQESPKDAKLIPLAFIEEDLRGTRKIVKAGVQDLADLHTALLPLLPLQNAPRLEAVDMANEIRLRTSELPPRAVGAFLSDVEEPVVARVLEDPE